MKAVNENLIKPLEKCWCCSKLDSHFSHLLSAIKGSSPNEACRAVLADIQRRIGGDKCFEIGLISLNMKVNTVFPDLSIINNACMLFELTRL